MKFNRLSMFLAVLICEDLNGLRTFMHTVQNEGRFGVPNGWAIIRKRRVLPLRRIIGLSLMITIMSAALSYHDFAVANLVH